MMRSRARFEEETGPAAVRRVPPGHLDALPVHALGALGIGFVLVELAWGNAGNRTGSSNHEKINITQVLVE